MRAPAAHLIVTLAVVECESVPEAGATAVYVAVKVSVNVPWFTP